MLSVLYVDDDEALLEIGKIFLERSADMQVDISRSAHHAFTLLATRHYDAIISDYEMPEMTGIAFLQNIRNTGNTIPFIIFTGKGREDIAIEAFDSGADYYIQKGGEAKSQFAELIHKVEKAVERKRTCTALERTNSLLMATLESTADGILVVGTDGKITACNQKFLQMWKIAEDLRPGDNDKKMLYSVLDQLENPEQFLRNVEEIYANPDVTSYDIIHFRDSRVYRRFSQAQKIGTTVVGRVWSFRDITLQNNAEHELRAAYEQLSAMEEELKYQYSELGRQVVLLKESEEKYRRVFDAESDPLLLIDRKTGGILDLNTASCQVYGYTRDKMLGLTLFDLLPESSHKGTEGGVEQHFIQASGHRRKNGTVFPVEVSSSELVLMGKNVLILSLRDVTRTRMIKDALKLTNVRLNLLLGITRHDILNKLTALVISNEMLSSRLADTGDREILKLQEKAIQEIKNHIDFTREYDNLGLQGPFWLPVEKMVQRSFAQFLRTISFRCEIHNLEIYVDPMMEKVFYNLFDNAFRYGEGISEISVSCLRKGNDLSIIFKDNGIGVSDDEKERIFERGYGKNTGFGLFFSREILSITGMEIHETGEYLNGAQFEIHIPAGHYRFTDPARESCDCHESAEVVLKSNYCEQEI